MNQKIKLDGKEYSFEDLSEQSMAQLLCLQFSDTRLKELSNMQAILQRAKNSYIESLKQEMLSKKAGFTIGND